jgi:hypothetical protein
LSLNFVLFYKAFRLFALNLLVSFTPTSLPPVAFLKIDYTSNLESFRFD